MPTGLDATTTRLLHEADALARGFSDGQVEGHAEAHWVTAGSDAILRRRSVEACVMPGHGKVCR